MDESKGSDKPFAVSLSGPAPIGSVALRLEPGVSALYGLNGAGKTSVLSGIRTAFSGVDPSPGYACLHFRINQEQLGKGSGIEITIPPEDDPIPLGDAIRPVAKRTWESTFGEFASLFPPQDWMRIPPISLADTLQNLLMLRMSKHDEALIQEVMSSPCITLLSVGHQSSAWRIYLSAQISESTPALRSSKIRDEKRQELTSSAEATGDIPDRGSLTFDYEYVADGMPWWVPVPLIDCGVLQNAAAIPLLIDETRAVHDLPGLTLDAFTGGNAPMLIAEGEEVVIQPIRRQLLDALSHEATKYLRTLLLDSPPLECRIAPPDQWLNASPLTWLALDEPTGASVPLERLSRAQSRWSFLASALSVAVMAAELAEDPLGAMLIDEPEAALHVRAERRVVQGLTQLAHELNTPVIVATHSREFLNNPELHLVHTSRDHQGLTQVEEMSSELRARLSPGALGLEPADLLQTYRVLLLVEGDHDEAVFKGLLGDALEEIRVRVIPFRGTHNAFSIVDATLIWDFTSCDVVVLVDHVDVPTLLEDWSKAQRVAKTSPQKARRHLKRLEDAGNKDRGTEEARVLYELALRGISSGRSDRLWLESLPRTDIYRYLPVEAFIPQAADWDEVEAEWKRTTKRAIKFKAWMAETKNAPITTETVTAAVTTMDSLPEDLIQVLETCRKASLTSALAREHPDA